MVRLAVGYRRPRGRLVGPALSVELYAPRYHQRRLVYLVVFWICGYWAAEHVAKKLHRDCLARIRKLEEALWTEFRVEAFKPAYVDRLYNAPRLSVWEINDRRELSRAAFEAKKAEAREAKAQAFGYHQVIPGYQAPRYHPGALQMPTLNTLLAEVTPRCVCGAQPDSHINRREMRPDRAACDWQIRTYCTSCHTNVITPVNSQAVDVQHLQAAVRLHLARYHREAVETETRRNHLKALLTNGPLISSAQAAKLTGDGGADTETAPAPREALP